MTSVLVAIPSGKRGWAPDFCLSLVRMVQAHEHSSDMVGVGLSICCASGANLCLNRSILIEEALAEGFSHVLWLDDDMTFPADALARLLAHDLPIVASNCTLRLLPILPTALQGGQRLSSHEAAGLEQVDRIGLAVALTQVGVFDRIPKPWFAWEIDDGNGPRLCSEDEYFCVKAQRAGFDIFIDHDLSQQIGHVGELTFYQSMIDPEELAVVNREAAKGRTEMMRDSKGQLYSRAPR